MDFAARIKSMRRQRHLTQDQVASALDISRQAVAKWESGTCCPDVPKLVKLADLYDMSLDALVLGTAADGADASSAGESTPEEALGSLKHYEDILTALSQEYLNIYSINLSRDQVRIIKLNGYVTAGIDINDDTPLAYTTLYERYINDRVHPDDVKKMKKALSIETIRTQLGIKGEYSGSYRVIDDGEVHYYQFKCFRTASDDRHVIIAFGNIDAIMSREAARKAALEEEVNKTHALLRVFRSVYYLDLDNDTFYEVSCGIPEMRDLVGVGGSQLSAADAICGQYEDKAAATKLRDFLDSRTVANRLLSKDWISEQTCTPYAGWTEFYLIAGTIKKNGKLADCYLATHSIEEQKQREQKAETALKQSRTREKMARTQAYRDALTDLQNRRAYDEALVSCAEYASVGVIFCDVNGLKATNDAHGHAQGDDLLRSFANLLRQYFSDDTLYRIGGDEFVLIVPYLSEQSLNQRYAALHAAMRDASNIAASGAAWGTGADVKDLITQAENAMYEEKIKLNGARC